MKCEEKHPCTYLRAGRHKVIKRKLNYAETPALKTFYNNININDSIEVFHYAETTKGVYRDCTVEADHQRGLYDDQHANRYRDASPHLPSVED
jgi:hypothetical protein